MAKILIVEDDGLVAGYMAQTLRQAGHTPILAEDGRSALRKAADRPDLVLLDLGLLDLPGEKLLQSLRKLPETARVPVLVITGRQDAAAALGPDLRDGIRAILLKPVAPDQLCRAVNGVLEDRGEPA